MGYAFDNGFRLEGELAHRFNQIGAGGAIDRDGDVHAWSAMLNLFYDFNKGGGVRAVHRRRRWRGRDSMLNMHRLANFDDDDTVVAYQGLAGLAFDLTEQLGSGRRLSLFRRLAAALNSPVVGPGSPATYDVDSTSTKR